MVDLKRIIEAEKENVEKALGNLLYTVERKDKTIVELAAIATFLHNIYNGMENILKQVLKAKGIPVPRSETWHKDLLEKSAASGIIPRDLTDELYEYLTFRHFFIHAYGFMLEEAHLESLAGNIPEICRHFFSAITKYY